MTIDALGRANESIDDAAETVELLREIEAHGEEGDIAWHKRHGKVYTALDARDGADGPEPRIMCMDHKHYLQVTDDTSGVQPSCRRRCKIRCSKLQRPMARSCTRQPVW